MRRDSQVVARNSGFPERQLWCAVVERALTDAVGADTSAQRDEARRREREDALNWFRENGRDYQMACDAAGVDADHLRHRVLRLAAQSESRAFLMLPGVVSETRGGEPA